MTIKVNNQDRVFSEAVSIADVLAEIDMTTIKGVAVAVNSLVVPKSEWGNFMLSDDDSLVVIRATQGG